MSYARTQRENEKSLKGRFKLFFETEFWRSTVVRWLLGIGILANAANWIILAVFIRPIDANIILHYNVYFGVDMMGSWKLVYVLPGVGLILWIVNLMLGSYFYRNKERVACHVLLLASLMAQLSLIVASASVIVINY